MRFIRMSRLEPEEVFNPRKEYDPSMYIARPDHERQFKNALRNDLCILIHGQSGTGKTWLTRRVLIEEDYYFKPINLASASSAKSIASCFKNIMARENWQIKTKYTETKNANVKIPIADGGISHAAEYVAEVDYFLEFLKFMKHRAKNRGKKRYIVFENFEAIVDSDELIKELTNLIILIDDDEVLKFNTKIIVVAATGDIQSYFKRVSNINTIDNRVMELPEIRTLKTQQSFELVERGFDKLDIHFNNQDDKEFYKREIAWITGGVPQRLHEFCLELSIRCKENNWSAKKEYLQEATKTWLSTSLNKNYAAISKIFVYDSRSISRKNQVLFCLGLKEKEYFTTKEISEDLITEFPISTFEKKINVTPILNSLCSTDPIILYKDQETKKYRFADNKFTLCLRSMLYKDEVENVQIYDLDDI
ncbi:hypothetical protein [Niallia sp. FSL W8-1348]|uniref:hypothetical protein n=1 Tax=Niallia sp. FSL W8-1348 TaxID=2954656 RepID=UPI0030F72CA0